MVISQQILASRFRILDKKFNSCLCPIENIYSHFFKKLDIKMFFFWRVYFFAFLVQFLDSVVWIIVDPPSKKTLNVVGESSQMMC